MRIAFDRRSLRAARPRSLRTLALVGALAVAGVATACSTLTPSIATSAIVAATPWQAGERFTYALTNSEGAAIGQGVLTTTQDGDRLVLDQQYTEAAPPAGVTPTRDEISVTVDATTLLPIGGQRETLRRDASGRTTTERDTWTYRDEDGTPHLAVHRQPEGSAARDTDIALRTNAYDNESSLWLWRSLAFAEGYLEHYVSANPFERNVQTVELRVPQREAITVPAGTFNTWRLLLRNGRAVRTAWVNVDAPHQVVRWDNGDVIFDLLKSE